MNLYAPWNKTTVTCLQHPQLAQMSRDAADAEVSERVEKLLEKRVLEASEQLEQRLSVQLTAQLRQAFNQQLEDRVKQYVSEALSKNSYV